MSMHDDRLESDIREISAAPGVQASKSVLRTDAGASIYLGTKTKSRKKADQVFAFGRETRLDGRPADEGGYVLWVRSGNYAGHVRGGISYNWKVVKEGLSYAQAVQLMNRRVGYVAFAS